jgi:DNA-binding CsgD family transcriptional regulator
MNSTRQPSLSRTEWYAALLFAHGATSNELANSLHVRPPMAQKLTLVARAKLHVGSRSELRATLLAA